MKRIIYVSKYAPNLCEADIANIRQVSQRNNQLNHITGVLLCSNGVFLQIVEGEAAIVDRLYQKILQDPRHVDIICLKTEIQIQSRQFPDWSMNVIELDKLTDLLIDPIKIILNTLVESHTILEKYTQPAVMKIIENGINPLSVKPKNTEKIILFSDIIAFSTLCEKMPPNDVVSMVNQYLDICSQHISRCGGEINKFIGDSVMASFAVDQVDQCIAASLRILEDLENLRQSTTQVYISRFLYCGIGFAQGMVVEGNFGSSVKMDYTLLGDVVNRAARLETLTRTLGRSLLFTQSIKNSASESWPFMNLGQHALKGMDELVGIYSIDSPYTQIPTGLQVGVDIKRFLALGNDPN